MDKPYKIYNENDRLFYRHELNSILKYLENMQVANTCFFENITSSFRGKDNRRHLLKCLYTLESDGLIEKMALGSVTHKWRITLKGLEHINNLKK